MKGRFYAWKTARLILILVFVIATYIILFKMIGIRSYLPHERIEIRVPYSLDNEPIRLIPMGETTYHPENGHPGIDFGWNHTAEILSSSDGYVTVIRPVRQFPNLWHIEVSSGAYILRYNELEDYNRDLRRFSRVKKGDLIGWAGDFSKTGHRPIDDCCGIHWELASKSLILDRWCPTTYFDSASRSSIERVWDLVPADDIIKQEFPLLCNLQYEGHAEKLQG